ncbi:anti-sigma F factor antagonist [Thermovenabulum gondwanense]|uniref:Anti-sigma F factor antagonist n=1 Tax=Thermovenabulum gondwanense TaxID=520767 RepID=A0A162MGL4_9FIRM|nr:anti-sigma F factor antagonist [Thermovenabulum gondwanense]KYO65796.1 Anti-sigma F factor antagonist [Thermovenabulum gondwanense]
MLHEGVTFRYINDVMIVNLKGELDHHVAARIKDDIDYVMSRKNIKKIIFNFKNVTFMDSSGIGMLLGRYKSIKSVGGALGVCNVNERIKKVFDISGLFNIIPCYTDENDALEKI